MNLTPSTVSTVSVLGGFVLGLGQYLAKEFLGRSITTVVANYLPGPDRPRSPKISGAWHSCYEIPAHGDQKQCVRREEEVQLKVRGQLVKMKRAGRPFKASCKWLPNGIVSGEWEDRHRNVGYRGFAQFTLNHGMTRMEGWWVGYSTSGGVLSGEWTLTKVGEP